MILPIVAYGDPVLRKVGKDITKDYPKLEELIANMTETMKNAQGVGLAAPQIGKDIRLFLIDASPFADSDELEEEEKLFLKGFNKIFINAQIIEEEGEEWIFNEGCLSIPNVREDVFRKPKIKIEYQDEDFETHIEEFEGLIARVIQHEYDHIEGILFLDRLTPLKRRMLQGRLKDIAGGKVNASYRMKFDVK